MKTVASQIHFILLSILLAMTAHAQVLPKPEPPFKGKIGRTVKDSTPDFPKRGLKRRRRTEHPLDLDR
jgi:hypothetical protein